MMPNTQNRVAIDRVQWTSVLPVLRLAGAFRLSLQPGKLTVALLAVLLLNGSGLLLDLIWGSPVDQGVAQEQGVYETIVMFERQAFGQMVESALSFELGLGTTQGVTDALFQMFVGIPGMAISEHPWFMLVFGLTALTILGLTSGIICRMAAGQVCMNRGMALTRATRFVARRWVWYLLTPLMPALLVLVVGAVLMLLGLIFFNVAVLDVIGALLYGLLLLLGFVIALVAVLFVFGLFLMAPAMSVEGTDGFDVISRSFNYVMFRPWHYATYLVSAVAYAAVIYVVVSAVWGLTVDATYKFVEVGSLADVEMNAGETVQQGGNEALTDTATASRYQAIISQSQNEYGPDLTLPNTAGPASWIIGRWFDLLTALVVALMFSLLCCLQTQVYVLLRRSADGTPLDECADDEVTDPWSSPADMVDPQAQAIAAEGPSAATRPITDEQSPTSEE